MSAFVSFFATNEGNVLEITVYNLAEESAP